eukprot:scaffold44240_cov59-Phaeocystis_antarctica.AAC.4
MPQASHPEPPGAAQRSPRRQWTPGSRQLRSASAQPVHGSGWPQHAVQCALRCRPRPAAHPPQQARAPSPRVP